LLSLEFLGSAFIMLSFNLTMPNYMMRGFAFFICYFVGVHISGAHFNPATTLAVFIVEQKYKEQWRFAVAMAAA